MDVYASYLTNGNQGIDKTNSSQDPGVPLTLDTAQQLSAELEQRINQSKHNILKAISNNSKVYEEAVVQASRAQKTIAELLGGVDGLQAMLGDEESGIQARLVLARRNEQLVREQRAASSAVLGCLRGLSTVCAEIRLMDASVRAGELAEAARIWRRIRDTVDSGLGGAVRGARIEAVLGQRLEMASVDIRDKVLEGLKSAISIETGDGGSRLTVRAARSSSSSSSVQMMADAARSLGAAEQVRRSFGSYFIGSFVRPVLLASGPALQESNDTDGTFSVTLQESSSDAYSVASICDAISGAMRFAGSAAGQAQLWEPACAAEICELAARRFVIEGSGLPVSRKALSAFSTNESTLKLLGFEAALLALCSKGSETAAEARLPIHKAVGRVAELYTERRCEQALDRARALAEDSSFAVHAMDKHELWDADLARTFAADAGDEGLDCVAQQIDKLAASGSPEEAAAGSLETPVFPQCSISKSIHELVRLAYSLANEALLAGTEGTHAWIGALGDALDIYCALFPMLHQQELQRVPALGWQFVNDCMYAAHHASLLTRILPQLSDSPARAFLGAGDSQRRHLIQRQAEELAAQARGSDDMFYMASDEKKQVRLLKAAKQVRATLEHIARGMRPPATTPNVFYTVMGSCVDAVFDATIEAVVDVRDIGVDDSKALSDHCRRVLSLTALLPLDQQALAPYASLAGHGAGSADGQQGIYADSLLAESDDEDSDSEAEAEAEADGERRRDAVGSGGGEAQRLGDRYCRLKDKLAQLADILVISRADILARRRAGLLSQFAVDELVRLVRALFSDTSERARDIEVLKTELADM